MLFDNQIFSIFLNRIIRLLPKGEFSRNISILAGSSALAQGISVLTAPIITRLYGPSDYGIVAAFSSVISLILIVATLRFEWAIPNPEEDGVAINVFIICFIVTAVVGIIAFPVFLILSNIFKNTSIFGTIAPYIWLIPLYIFGGASYQTLNAWAIRKKNFTPIAKTRLSQSLSGASVNIGLGILKWGSLGLLLGGLVSQAAGIGTLGKLLWREDHKILRKVSMTGIVDAFNRYGKFACLSTGVSIVNTASLQVTIILLNMFYGPVVVGWYALAQRIIGLPTQLIGQAASQTFWAESARLVRSDPVALKRLFLKFAKKLSLFSLAIAGLGIISPFTFGLIFGKEQWTMAGYYALFLTPLLMAQFVVSTISHLVVHELQHWQLIWDIIRLILIALLFMLAHGLDFSPGSSLVMYSLLMSGMYGILFIMNLRAIALKIKRIEEK